MRVKTCKQLIYLKEKVAANFNTAKADAILEKAGVEDAPAENTITEETNVLVLCAGGGTSGLLANALNKAAAEYKVPVKAAAGGYGAHREMLPEFDLPERSSSRIFPVK